MTAKSPTSTMTTSCICSGASWALNCKILSSVFQIIRWIFEWDIMSRPEYSNPLRPDWENAPGWDAGPASRIPPLISSALSVFWRIGSFHPRLRALINHDVTWPKLSPVLHPVENACQNQTFELRAQAISVSRAGLAQARIHHHNLSIPTRIEFKFNQCFSQALCPGHILETQCYSHEVDVQTFW